MKKSVMVYYSVSGNARQTAERLVAATGACGTDSEAEGGERRAAEGFLRALTAK